MSLVSKQPKTIAETDSTRANNKGQKKERNQNQTGHRDYIWKVLVAIGFLIPLFFFAFFDLMKSNGGFQQDSSELSNSGEIKVKTAAIESTRIEKPSKQPETDIIQMESNNYATVTNSTGPVRIQIASDLHIEFFGEDEDLNFLIEPKAPILALLGDVGYACTQQLRKFLLSQCDRFEEVWFLAGNHEYYNHGGTHYSVTEQDAWLQQVASERPNLKYLEKSVIPMWNGNVVVLATTLWSDIPDNYLEEAEHFLNDYRLSYNHAPSETAPRLLRASETRQWYRDNLNWLQTQLQTIYDQNKIRAQHQQQGQHHHHQEQQTKVIVLTHHTPLMIGTSAPQYEGMDSTHCFSSDLQSLMVHPYSPIDIWACGHTHYNFDLALTQNETSSTGNGSSEKLVRVVSNQRGYQSRPKPDYRADGIVLEIR
ncbi:unnamed protein product [Cylindrotheca closterium]|uniref:Calcineurin-like phosphoesterase domain-containing protein n=1 Tax=Cylindrotheca closterium TaxID=2856 RepID=A0AAD2GAR7_9STRA|nr:unnamed protein product [Cylindrotheca closterium]